MRSITIAHFELSRNLQQSFKKIPAVSRPSPCKENKRVYYIVKLVPFQEAASVF
jgi:hypothetical protein